MNQIIKPKLDYILFRSESWRWLLLIGIYVAFPYWIAASTLNENNEENAMKLSLEQAKEYALEHSIKIKTAMADLEIAEKQIWEITSTGLPQLDASVGYQYYFNIPTSLVPAEFFGGEPGEFAEIQFGIEQNLNASATLSQLLFDGSYIVGLRAARIFKELANQNLKRSEIEIRSTVTESYLLVLLSRENLEIVQQNLGNMQQTLTETEQIFKAGFTDPINVDQLKLAVANMKNTIANLERQNTVTLNLLKFQLGFDISLPIELTDSLEGLFESIALEAESVAQFEIDNHIDLQIMRSQQTMDFMSMRREQSFMLPRLSASYTYQQMAMRNEFNFFKTNEPWFPTSFLAVNLDIPIFSSGNRSSRIQQAKLKLEKSELATAETAQMLKLQMQQARADFETAQEKYGNEKENLSLAQRILQRTTIMHREGLASSLELTQANDQFLMTQANFLNSIFELLNARNNIQKARGI
ncbi:MAG: TolC family protein [Bacteroidales bacterium]|nr:TolC family protein [Bacteroidales bacterium]